jgi:hypothetical protein
MLPLVITFWYFHYHHNKVQKLPYLNTKTTLDGTLWYILSIVASVGAYHGLFDFYFVFQDFVIFSNGMSLFYTWQTYEKNDIAFSEAIMRLRSLVMREEGAKCDHGSVQKITKDEIERMRLKSMRKSGVKGAHTGGIT